MWRRVHREAGQPGHLDVIVYYLTEAVDGSSVAQDILSDCNGIFNSETESRTLFYINFHLSFFCKALCLFL